MKAGDTDFDISLSEDLGQITINNDVVARVAAVAAMQVPGVSLGGKFNIGEFLSRKEPVRGVSVEVAETRTRVAFEIKVEYGQNMYEIAHKLQRRVKDAVEKMTGLVVEQVNVSIVDILPEAEKRERPEKREEK
jgi:uncharacterized alkaline shock family protein YloU